MMKRVSAEEAHVNWLRRGSSAVEAVAGVGVEVITEEAATKIQAAVAAKRAKKAVAKKRRGSVA